MATRADEDFIGFKAPSDLAEGVRRAAERHGRSVSGYMRYWLRKQLETEERIFGPLGSSEEHPPEVHTTS